MVDTQPSTAVEERRCALSSKEFNEEVVSVLAQAPRLRLSGHGERLRLRQRGPWHQEPLEAVRECCRASMAVDKALGEAIREARAAGASWPDVGRVLGVAENAETEQDVIAALAEMKREVWRRFWA